MRAYTWMIALGMSLGSLAWSFPLPISSGTYSGSGSLTQTRDGLQMDYEVTTSLDAATGVVQTEYVFGGGLRSVLSFELADAVNGIFAVTTQGLPAGEGYCRGNACHVDLDYTSSILGYIHVSISYTFGEDWIVATGRNFSSNTIFQHLMTRVER